VRFFSRLLFIVGFGFQPLFFGEGSSHPFRLSWILGYETRNSSRVSVRRRLHLWGQEIDMPLLSFPVIGRYWDPPLLLV